MNICHHKVLESTWICFNTPMSTLKFKKRSSWSPWMCSNLQFVFRYDSDKFLDFMWLLGQASFRSHLSVQQMKQSSCVNQFCQRRTWTYFFSTNTNKCHISQGSGGVMSWWNTQHVKSISKNLQPPGGNNHMLKSIFQNLHGINYHVYSPCHSLRIEGFAMLHRV